MDDKYTEGFLAGERHYKKYMYGVLNYLNSSLKEDGEEPPKLSLDVIIKLLEDVEKDTNTDL